MSSTKLRKTQKIIITILVICWGYLGYKFLNKNQDDSIWGNIQFLNIYTVYEEFIPLQFEDFDSDKLLLLIYFNTHCSFCQLELKCLARRVPEFKNTEILLISAEPLDTLRKVNSELQFDLYPNVGIYHCPYDTLQNYFGKLVAPTTFIYSKDKRLLKKFKGATSINDMLEVIEKEMIKNGEHPLYEYE